MLLLGSPREAVGRLASPVVGPVRFAGSALGVVLMGLLCSGCILDLDGLTTASQGGQGGEAGQGGQGGGGGGAGGGAGCAVLDCCPAGEIIELARGPEIADLPRGIVVGEGGVYWVNLQGNNVVRLAASGGPPEEIAVAVAPRGLALSGQRLAWTGDDGVSTCSLPACSGDAKVVAPSLAPGSLRSVAFDGATLVFTDRGVDIGEGKARSCSADACAPVDLGEGMIAPEGIVIHGGLALWVDQGNGNMNGTVSRSSKSSAGLTQIAAALLFPTGVAADDTYVYWTEQQEEGHVYRCPYAPGYCDAPEDIAPAAAPLGRPGDIQIAGGRIYWTNADDGSIRSCPQPGCGGDEPTVHVTGRQGLTRLAVGSTCLFWTENGGGGAVLKTAR